MICAFISRSSRGLTPFTDPCVPTGINAGVSITPCAVVNCPRLAFECRSVVESTKLFCIRTRDSATSLAMTNAAQNILCGVAFSLYLRGSPHRSVRDFFARPERVFCRPEHEAFGGALFLQCPRLINKFGKDAGRCR